MNYLYIIVSLCIVIIPVFFKTTKYNRGLGIILLGIGIFIFIIRCLLIPQYHLLAVYNRDTIPVSFIILFACLLFFFTFSLTISKLFSERRTYFLTLLPLYILFGALQQIFFLWIFTDAVFYLSNDLLITGVISVIYFFIFHLKLKHGIWNFTEVLFYIFLLIFSSINVYIYLALGNIIPQMVFHGILGTIWYTAFRTENKLSERWK